VTSLTLFVKLFRRIR